MNKTMYGLAYRGKLLGVSITGEENSSFGDVHYELTEISLGDTQTPIWLVSDKMCAELVSQLTTYLDISDYCRPVNAYKNKCQVVELRLELAE